MVPVAVGWNVVGRSLYRACDHLVRADRDSKSDEQRRFHEERERQHFAGSTGSGGERFRFANLCIAHRRTIGHHCRDGNRIQQHSGHLVDVAIGRNIVGRCLHRARHNFFGADRDGESDECG